MDLRAARDRTADLDSVVIYTALLTYHPTVGTFRGRRGAWRVRVCMPELVSAGIQVIDYYQGNGRPPVKALRMAVAKHLHPNTWVSPTKLLRELLAQRALIRQIESMPPYDGVANRAQYEAECAHAALAETA